MLSTEEERFRWRLIPEGRLGCSPRPSSSRWDWSRAWVVEVVEVAGRGLV